MERLIATWREMELARRLALVGALVVTLAAVGTIAMMAGRPGMALLYAGLEPAAAGEMIGALEQMGAVHEVRGNAIFVEEGARDRLRLALAGDGLPSQGQKGYELLEGLSGFSATTDMFNAAYWRAKEGELARTIAAQPTIRSARVHIAIAPQRRFARERTPPTASVTVTGAGGSVTAQQAAAIRYMVALAVPGLPPEQVAVIDSRAGMVLAPGNGEDVAGVIADAATRREARIKAELEEMLAARVGPGNARVSVSVALDRTGETLSERRFDPGSRIVVSEDTDEVSEESEGPGNPVTVASNLPDGEAAGGEGQRSQRREARARANYDYDETRRERVTRPGAVERLSVAVLVDGIREAAADGTVDWRPRPAEELEALGALVRAAVGFDEARGDVVVVETLAFQPPPPLGTASGPDPLGFLERNAMSLIQLAVLAGLVALIVLTVLRPLLASREDEVTPYYVDGMDPALTGDGDGALRQIGDDGMDAEIPIGLPDRETLRQAVAELPDNSVATLRDWLDSTEEEAA